MPHARARGTRQGLAAICALAAGGTLLAACGGGPPAAAPHTVSSAPARPTATFPAPSGLVAGAQAQPDGTMWLLADTDGTATLQELDLSTRKILAIVPESASAHSLAQSPSGLLAVGLATATTGAVELRNGSSGAIVATVPVGAPVEGLAAGADGSTLYVLDGTSSSSSVTLVNLETDRASVSVPVPLATVSIAVQPTERDIYALTASGKVDEIDVGTGAVTASFPVGPDPLQLAISSTGSTLYVLRRAGGGTNVGVVQLATERQTRAFAAPANCLGIQLSAGGRHIYDVVGTSRYGNVQVFPTGT